MTAPTDPPDVEDALVQRLLDQLDASVSVVRELDDETPAGPWPRPVVEVALVGGAPKLEGVVLSPLVSYTAHGGDDRTLAKRTANLVVAALRAGGVWAAWTAGGFCCTRGETNSDPVHLRDPNTREHSFSGTVQLVMRATG